MKIKCIFAVFISGYMCIASAQTLRPLSQYLNEVPVDNSSRAYVNSRCSAIFMSMQIISEDQRPDLGKRYQELSQEYLLNFIGASNATIREKNPSYVPPESQVNSAIATVQSIVKIYMNLLNDSYASTGSYFSNKTVKDDLQICQALATMK